MAPISRRQKGGDEDGRQNADLDRRVRQPRRRLSHLQQFLLHTPYPDIVAAAAVPATIRTLLRSAHGLVVPCVSCDSSPIQ
jgi:hypothetical protein